MAKHAIASGGARATKPASRGGLIVLILIGFVLVAMGVTLRRVYGYRQATEIRQLHQQGEALVSEQLKLQDAIRVASDRQHLIAVAQSRLNMKLPSSDQVIYLPRRPLVRGRDSLTP